MAEKSIIRTVSKKTNTALNAKLNLDIGEWQVYFKQIIGKMKNDLNECKAERKSQLEDIDTLNEKIKNLDEDKQKNIKQLQLQKKQLEDEYKKKKDAIKENVNKLMNETFGITSVDQENIDNVLNNLKSKIDDLQGGLEQEKDKIREEYKEKLKELEEKNNKIQEEIEENKKILNAIKLKVQYKDTEISELQQKIAELEEKNKKLEEENNKLKITKTQMHHAHKLENIAKVVLLQMLYENDGENIGSDWKDKFNKAWRNENVQKYIGYMIKGTIPLEQWRQHLLTFFKQYFK